MSETKINKNCVGCNRRTRWAICNPCKEKRDLRQKITALKAEVAQMRSQLRRIAEMGPEENSRLRKHDFVFNRPIGVPLPSDEAGRWEMLAFTLHSDVWEATSIAQSILDSGEGA